MAHPIEEYSELDVFIRANYGSMYAVALRFTSSPAAAEDIVQDVILRFWENRAKYPSIESVQNYLFIMVRNGSLNYLRSKKREQARNIAAAPQERDDSNMLNTMIEEEVNTMVSAAISGLPEQSRRIMRLAFSGLDNKQIAKLLSIAPNTVKTLKYIAMKKLREHFLKMNL